MRDIGWSVFKTENTNRKITLQWKILKKFTIATFYTLSNLTLHNYLNVPFVWNLPSFTLIFINLTITTQLYNSFLPEESQVILPDDWRAYSIYV